MLKKIAIALGVVIALILILASTQPGTFHVERKIVVNAKPAKVFALFNDLHSMSSWSPWEKKDPAMKRTYEGAKSGKGAVYAWDGNSQVGAGRMEITEVVPSSKIDVKLDFLRPMVAHDTVTYSFVKAGKATEVTWAMDGQVPFVGKIFHLFMNVDKMVGGDFETGLANVKAVVEKK